MIDNHETEATPATVEATPLVQEQAQTVPPTPTPTPAPAAKEVKEVKEVKEAPGISSNIPTGATVHVGKLEINGNSKNSASVRLIQQRLMELGHLSAGADLSGWLSNGTAEALAEFQAKGKIKADSVISRPVIVALMKGTSATVTQ